MSDFLQQIQELATSTKPGVGYRAKEQRRDVDRRVRALVASAYEEQRARLARLQQQAPLIYADDLEGLDQRLQKLIQRLKIAPRGYAGWFDAVQIIEADLDQLIQFDGGMAAGIARLQAQLDAIANALKANDKVLDAIHSDDPTALIGLPLIRTCRMLRAAGLVLP